MKSFEEWWESFPNKADTHWKKLTEAAWNASAEEHKVEIEKIHDTYSESVKLTANSWKLEVIQLKKECDELKNALASALSCHEGSNSYKKALETWRRYR